MTEPGCWEGPGPRPAVSPGDEEAADKDEAGFRSLHMRPSLWRQSPTPAEWSSSEVQVLGPTAAPGLTRRGIRNARQAPRRRAWYSMVIVRGKREDLTFGMVDGRQIWMDHASAHPAVYPKDRREQRARSEGCFPVAGGVVVLWPCKEPDRPWDATPHVRFNHS